MWQVAHDGDTGRSGRDWRPQEMDAAAYLGIDLKWPEPVEHETRFLQDAQEAQQGEGGPVEPAAVTFREEHHYEAARFRSHSCNGREDRSGKTRGTGRNGEPGKTAGETEPEQPRPDRKRRRRNPKSSCGATSESPQVGKAGRWEVTEHPAVRQERAEPSLCRCLYVQASWRGPAGAGRRPIRMMPSGGPLGYTNA